MDLGLGEGGGYVEKAKGYLDVVKGDMKAIGPCRLQGSECA